MNFTIRSFILILFLFPVLNAGRGGLELIHADKSTGAKLNGEQLRIFSGHVHFRQDTLEMFCDESIFYEIKNQADFSGNVLIDDGRNQIRANKIEYYPESRIALCKGNVRLTSSKDSLYAEEFVYNFKTKDATAYRHVFITDYENRVTVWGEYGEYRPDSSYSLMREHAGLTKIDTSSRDTLRVLAEQLQYFNEKPAYAVAIDSVIITQGALRAVCDTAIYNPDEEFVDLRHHPHAWFEDSELSGMQMTARFDSMKVREINLRTEAKAQTLVDSLSGTQNVLKGKSIDFFIREKKPVRINATGNASSVYYLLQEEKEQGVNFATADTILVFFQQGKLDSILIRGGSEGIYYPADYKGEKTFAE
jgi:lipopolysaccharide export system protein LptA